MKYPAVIIYKKIKGDGEELRYTLRGLKNLTNWNGEVFIVGDREDWFTSKVKFIDMKRAMGRKHMDIFAKMRRIISTEEIADDFMYFNDDMICTEKMELKNLNQGEIKRYTGNKGWLKIKQRTRTYLKKLGYEHPLDYDLHVPMILNKKKLAEALTLVEAEHPDFEIHIRSVYGNIHNLGGEYYLDGKYRWDAPINSTNSADDLVNIAHLLPEPSEFEKHKKVYSTSVIMAMYNTEKYIKRALDSIPKRFDEILVCDDGSTDSSKQVVKQWIKDNPDRNIRLLWNKENKGVGFTKNKLMDNVTKDYFTVLDSDDYFYSDIVKVINELDGADIVYYDLERTDGRRYRLANENSRNLHPGEVRFIRTEFLGDTRNNEERHAEDEALLKKLLKKKPIEKFTRILAKHYSYPREDSIRYKFLRGESLD